MSMYNKIIDLQKLGMAWQHVKKNHPADGVDRISWQQFEENKREELLKLHIELKEKSYESLPVREAALYKGEKVRNIALFSMRDKVVHQSVAAELEKKFESRFSDRAYAYRQGKSALDAIALIETAVKEYQWALKLDIHKFFDSLIQKRLLEIMRATIRDEDVMDLMRKIMRTKLLDTKTGQLTERKTGVYQGSSLAPIWSNIYMMEFDKYMSEAVPFYVRYSDDILCLGNTKEQMEQVEKNAENYLNSIGLKISESKRQMVSVEEGFTYLGYRFDKEGKSITQKAEESLKERLEVMWRSSANLTVEEKLSKGSEIVGGWEQYYRQNRIPGDILEYAVILYMTQRKEDEAERYEQMRDKYENIYADLCEWLVKYWEERKKQRYVLYEYEQFFRKTDYDRQINISTDSALFLELKKYYCQLLTHRDQEYYENLIQIYTDLGCYNKASAWQDDLRDYLNAREDKKSVCFKKSSEVEWEPDNEEFHRFSSLFVGREDIFAVEEINNGRRSVCTRYEPLTEQVLKSHFKGEVTVSTYVQRQNSTAGFFVIDIDVSKKIILQSGSDTEAFDGYLKRALDVAVDLKRKLGELGLQAYPEFSGYRGYHLWIFFQEWIPVRYVNALQDHVEVVWKSSSLNDGTIQLEYFPNKGRVRPDKAGQCIKIPYGIHTKTGKTSCFLEKDGEITKDPGAYFGNVITYSLKTIKRITGNLLAKNVEEKTGQANHREVDEDLSGFGSIDHRAEEVLRHCTLMRYLCQKARTTGYLGHFERLSVLYVFGHLGEPGKQFVHTVMEFTLNYDYHVTEKFIQRIPEKPVSCIKLREQYRIITAEAGCSCNFKRTSNCYPSPVLHAIKNTEDDISDVTIPCSRSMSKNSERKVAEELNIPKKVQQLSSQIVEKKRQKRSIDKAIIKLEKELETIFDQMQVNCMEIEMGMLVRRKIENRYEWFVEL